MFGIRRMLRIRKDMEALADWRKFDAAVADLAQIGKPAKRALTQALRHMDRAVRSRAFAALDRLGWLEMTDLQWLSTSEWACLQWQAVTALGKLGNSEAVTKPLIRVLDDPNPLLTRLAATTLDRLGWVPDGGETEARYRLASARERIACKQFDQCVAIGSAAVPPLIEHIAGLSQSKGFKDDRKRIVTVLGKLGDARAVPVLTEAASRDRSEGVRRRAQRSLDWIRTGHQ